MTTYTRVMVIGADHRADLAVPDGEPVAAMLPDILTLVRQTPGPVVLVTHTGDRLDPARSLDDQNVADGTALWVVPMTAAPPPAQVADIVELTADAHGTRTDDWNRRWALTATAPVVAVLAAFASTGLTRVAHWLVAGGLLAAAIVFARLRWTTVSVLAVAGATGTAIMATIMALADRPIWMTGLTCIGATAGVTGVVALAGFGDLSLGVGGIVGAALPAGLLGITAAGGTTANAAATVALAGIVVLSVAPGIAMTTSGLARLDDRHDSGDDIPRALALTAVNSAFRSLTWVVLGAAIAVSVCGAVVAGSQPWGRWLAVALLIALVFRGRVLPLAPQRITLILGALVLAVALLSTLHGWWPTLGAVAGAIATAVAVVSRPAPVTLARLNRIADVVETIAVIALLPLVVAQWGVFADLASTFR